MSGWDTLVDVTVAGYNSTAPSDMQIGASGGTSAPKLGGWDGLFEGFQASVSKSYGTDDRELLAKTLEAEAGGEGLGGMVAAGAVIDNRNKSGRYGEGIRGVIMKPGQFSAWNGVTGYASGQGAIDMDRVSPSADAYEAADLILSGDYEDTTGGATHYYNPDVANPAWGQRAGGDWQTIGNHVFGNADGRRGAGSGPPKVEPNKMWLGE